MKILITTFGSLGDLFPYMNIAKHLVEFGQSVTIASNRQHGELVESAGHAFRPIRPHIDPDPQFFQRVMDEFSGGRYLLRDILFPAIRDSFDDLMALIPQHDLLITHVATFAGPLAARQTGIPWISTVLAPISMDSAMDPSVAIVSLRKLRRSAPWLLRFINKLGKHLVADWSLPATRLRQELRQPETGNVLFEGQHSPGKVLALFSEHFAASQPDWPPQATATGFPLTSPEHLPESIEHFLASGEPPVVMTLGSSAVMVPGTFFEVARTLGRRVLLLAGPHAHAIPPTADLLAVEYAPHSAVFAHAAAIIHQGGIGTTSEVLRSGRPSIVVPFAHDQPDNAARLERLGVARVLPRRQLNARRLRTEIQDLLSDERYGRNAASVGNNIRQEDGALNAARQIVDFNASTAQTKIAYPNSQSCAR